jgi:Cyclic nucleotide-binding domain
MPYRSLINHPTSGVLVPLVIVRDREALQKRRALAHRLVGKHPTTTQESEVLAALGAESVVKSEAAGGLTEMLGQFSDDGGLALFERMTDEDRGTILAGGHVLHLADGDALVRAGHRSETLYAVLAGTLEVRRGGSVIDVVSRGDIFGEVGFLLQQSRTADVVTVGAATVVAFDSAKLRALIDGEPRLAAILLLNLSRLICRKQMTGTHE